LAVGAAISPAWATSGPKLIAPSQPSPPTEAVVLTISAPGLMYVDGCAPIELEKHAGEAWEVVASAICESSRPATRVDRSLTVSLPAQPAGEYRAVMAWGTTCTDGVPFFMASCRKTGSIRSDPFVVGTPSAPASPPGEAPGATKSGSTP
jgi:hypothetical protein